MQHSGNGIYTISATIQQAGSYQMLVQLEQLPDSPGAPPGDGRTVVALQCEVMCTAAAAAAECCRVEMQTEPWIAGRAAEVVVHQYDRSAVHCIHFHSLNMIFPHA